MYLRSVQGIEGEIKLPANGATIGTTQKWTLRRKEDAPSSLGLYTFQAVLNYINPLLWDEPAFKKEIRIRIGKNGRQYRLEQQPSGSTQLDGVSLRMEDVALWPLAD